ncbi:hypothetical protein E2562_013545 [Oryza meyeriana var. granulata]|uniref:Uncharacterized protein n=1 Tax=Oryza meyeriana var. granulata TaxID=110450 RepID=A0A6G1D243_9ORYZ|nr:hypothetical protein E2562_013545 [Oryza meyeriana var. granulata]
MQQWHAEEPIELGRPGHSIGDTPARRPGSSTIAAAIDGATVAMRRRAETDERRGNAMMSLARSGEEGRRRARTEALESSLGMGCAATSAADAELNLGTDSGGGA